MGKASYIILLFVLLFLSCNTIEPVNDVLRMQLQGVSCTEAFIKLSGIPGSEITLRRNDDLLMRFNLTNSDTIITDPFLTPNTKYIYRVTGKGYIRNSNGSIVTANTLDTTSHNFTWQKYEFGEHSRSILYDVAIIDENNIWAVGEIYQNDPLGVNDPNPYNAAHWDGKKWELKQIESILCGGKLHLKFPLFAIYVFTKNNIWFSDGLEIIHWNGQNFSNDCSVNSNINGKINKIWGSSSKDLYAAGDNGSLVHFDGKKWQKIESNTDLDICDIYGGFNQNTGKKEILAIASGKLSYNKVILKIDENTASEISSYPLQWQISSAWFIPGVRYYIAGSGIYQKKFLSDSSWKNNYSDITRYDISKLRGTNLNDIAGAGGLGEVFHFNGISWMKYFEKTRLINGDFYSVAIKDNLIIAVGADGYKAVITIGTR